MELTSFSYPLVAFKVVINRALETGYCTTCVMVADVLPAKLFVAPYTALTLCVPLLSDDVLKVAVPLASSVPVPSVVPPSLKLTVPVGVAPVGGVTLTVDV